MKVAFLHFWTLRLRRGVETLVVSLANALAGRDVDVSIITARQTQIPLVSPLPQVRVKQFPTFRYFEFASIAPFYALDLIQEHYDIVVVFFADFGEAPALALADQFHRSRLVLYLTFPLESAPHRYHAYREFNWDKRADVLIADAEYTAKKGQEFFSRPVNLLPSGTDPKRFEPNPTRRRIMRRQLGFKDDDVVLLNVAALEHRKGAWRVIEALPNVRVRCPNIRYLVLGNGPERGVLEARAIELGVRDVVIFAGTTTELPGYYNAADIFVMLSDAEAGSIALLEAMASALPVLVPNTGGFGEVVNEMCGQFVALDDRESIIAALDLLTSNVEHREKCGTVGRQQILKAYSWERLVERFLLLAN